MVDKLNLRAEDKLMNKILFGNEKYMIPRYQRPYAWEEDHINDFWNDLREDSDSYFIGSFVFNYENVKDEGFIEVIDGQQRLLTITIFLAVLRDISKEINLDKFSDLIQTKGIVFEDIDGNTNPRITCGESTKEFFSKYIQSGVEDIESAPILTREDKRIKASYSFLKEKVYKKLEDIEAKSDKLEYLKKLRDRARNINTILIRIANEEEAYEIFETVNARGVDLSVSDLLKNMIFKKVQVKAGKDIAKEKWSEIEANVRGTGMELSTLVRYYWLSKHEFVTERKLYRCIKQKIDDWDVFLDDLLEASNLYNKFYVGTEADWENIEHGSRIYKSIDAVTRFMNVRQCQVLFLSILRNIDRLNTDPVRVFELIEKFTFKYSAICKLPGNKVEKIYSRFAIDIENTVNESNSKHVAANVNRIFDTLKNELLDISPSSEFFKEKFMEVSYRQSERSRLLIKYILDCINSLFGVGEHKINFDTVNIEHVLPQNPDMKWDLSKADIKDYVNLLGNLTLLHEKLNSKVGNSIIKEKIKELRKSEIAITKELVKLLEDLDYTWTEDNIRRRQEGLSEIAYNKVWKDG